MGHGCHYCGSPNSCECDEIAEEDRKNDAAIDAALQTLNPTQLSRLKSRFIDEQMERDIYVARCKAEQEVKARYGRR